MTASGAGATLRPFGIWGRSSVGRASRSQCEGREFEPPRLHQVFQHLSSTGTANRSHRDQGRPGFAGVGADGTVRLDWSALPEDATKVIQEITQEEHIGGRGHETDQVRRTKFKLYSKLDALEKLGRHLGMFADKTTVDETIRVIVRDEWVRNKPVGSLQIRARPPCHSSPGPPKPNAGPET